MRVTAEVKNATRRRILDTARECFSRVGFEAATTRELAAAAGIAAGTLFNYFPAKEAIAMALVVEALGEARQRYEGLPRGESLEEDLYALVSAELRSLRPHRDYLRPVLETFLSPLARTETIRDGEAVRVGHLEAVNHVIANRCPGMTLPPLALNLYWTLYTGVLAFWACDTSPHQEDTRAVLDHYLKAFVASLSHPE